MNQLEGVELEGLFMTLETEAWQKKVMIQLLGVSKAFNHIVWPSSADEATQL